MDWKGRSMKFMSTLIVFAAALLGLGTSATSESKPAPVVRRLMSDHPRIRELHNVATRWRAQSGMPVQMLDEELCVIAQRWANNMAARGVMYHGGGEQVVAQGYANAEACIQGWCYSPGHRRWVMGGNTRCGFGCQRGANGQLFWAGVYR